MSNNGTYYEDLSAKQEHILQSATAISGFISIIACLFVLWTYIRYKEIRIFHFRMILYLTITDFLCSVILVIGSATRVWSVSGGDDSEPSYSVCIIIGILVQFFLLAGLLWTVCIAHTLFMVLTVKDYNPERFEIAYHIFSWGIPLLFDIILIFTNSIGDSGVWCWIKGDSGHQIFRYLFLYIPLLVVIATNIVLYIFSFLTLRKEKKQFTPKIIPGGQEQLFYSGRDPYSVQTAFGYFTGILFICWFFPVLNGILHAINPDEIYFTVYFMNALLLPLQGFFNSIIYGLNDEIRRELKKTPIFAKIGGYISGFKHFCCNLPCFNLVNKTNNDSINIQSTSERKKWYASIMSEYDETPERREENNEITEAILSTGKYTSQEFDNIFSKYEKD